MDEAILKILEEKLDSRQIAEIRLAIEDANRITVIRDAFLSGKDVEAISLIKHLDLTKSLDEARKKIDSKANTVLGIRRTILGISTMVPPGSTQVITVRPQRVFKVDRLAVSRLCSSYFIISSIRVGNQYQEVALSEIAADLLETSFDESSLIFNREPGELIEVKIDSFVESRIGIPIDMDTCQTAQDLSMFVMNTDLENSRRFSALYLGVTPM